MNNQETIFGVPMGNWKHRKAKYPRIVIHYKIRKGHRKNKVFIEHEVYNNNMHYLSIEWKEKHQTTIRSWGPFCSEEKLLNQVRRGLVNISHELATENLLNLC